MESKISHANKIVGYLKSIYPKAATLSEISKETRISSCSIDPWVQTLIANRDIEIVEKKGRSNLYRFKSNQ